MAADDDGELPTGRLLEQIAEQLAMKMLAQYGKTLRPMMQFIDACAAKLAYAEVSDEPDRSRLVGEVRQKLEALSQDEQLRDIVALADREEST